jgi:hypothetical protein
VHAYRPASAAPLVLLLGTWKATAQPDRTATITMDPRLWAWLINQAAKRAALSYQVNEGNPPVTVQLV